MLMPAGRRLLWRRFLSAALVLSAAGPVARSDQLPNELAGDSSLAVAVRGAAGNRYRPGRSVLLRITVHNRDEPFEADVRVRESRSGGEAVFRGAPRVSLLTGANTCEILAAPAGGAAGTVLEVLRPPAGDGGGRGEPVFRGDLSRVLQPLGGADRLLVAVGVDAFPLPRGFVHVVTEPRDLPAAAEAYAAADVVVLERVRRGEVSSRQAEALVSWMRSGGDVVFASFRAVAPFEGALFGDGPAPRTPDQWREAVPGSGETRIEGPPSRVEFPFGLGRGYVYAAEPGDAAAWRGAAGRVQFASRDGPDPWVDPAAFGTLAPGRPFRSSAERAWTVALVGALAACVVTAVFATRRRAVAAGLLGGAAVLWAAAAALAFDEPDGAVRTVRVRSFTADRRAEIVTDTVVAGALADDVRLGLETRAPASPVAHRRGELLGAPHLRSRKGDGWLIGGLRVRRGTPVVVRSRRAGGLEGASESLRTRVLARGRRVGVEKLPGGGARLDFGGEEPAPDIRYLLERFAPPGEELAWLWIEGEPEGVCAIPEGRFDPAPGSGTLAVAAAPREN